MTTVGSAGMYVVVVALPAFESDFASARADAAIPYPMVMIGFGFGGIITGRLVDRFGIARPLAMSALALWACPISARQGPAAFSSLR